MIAFKDGSMELVVQSYQMLLEVFVKLSELNIDRKQQCKSLKFYLCMTSPTFHFIQVYSEGKSSWHTKVAAAAKVGDI